MKYIAFFFVVAMSYSSIHCNRNLESEILTFLVDKKQITIKQKDKYKNNLTKYVTIESLEKSKKIKVDDGLYVFYLNSSHSYKYFLLYKNKKIKIIDSNSDLETIMKESSEFNLTLSNSDLIIIKKILDNNEELKKQLYIKPLN